MVMLVTCIQQVPASNLDWDTDTLVWYGGTHSF
jgi:hypothetical protein